MNKAEFDRLKAEINRRPLTDYYTLTPSKGGMYCCPICGSGTGPNHTGALKLYGNHGEGPRVFCAKGCFTEKGESTLDALCRLWNTDAAGVMDKLGMVEAPARKTKQAPPEDYTAAYKKWHQALLDSPEAMKYLTARGINRATIDELNLGYAPRMGYGTTQAHAAPRIIFPYDAHFFKARRIDAGEAKYIPSSGGRHLYNADAFSDTDKDGNDRHLFPVLIVEGELDAAACIQGGWKRTIALGSTANKGKFVEDAKRLNPGATYILALDNDGDSKAGQQAQAELVKLMEDAGLDFISADTSNLYGQFTDAADAALHDAGSMTFWQPLMDLMGQGAERRESRERAAAAEAYFHSGPGMVDAFLAEVKGDKYKPMPTGIQAIDDAIGGGLYRQTIVMLGAAPGAGKTSLAAQMCESIAKQGTDVLYINLEMSREQLLARSLARIAYLKGSREISSTEILRGYEWTIETEEAVHEAADEYKATIAQHLLYNPGEDTTDLDAIMEKIEAERARLGHAPIICLDYLQLLTGHTADGRDEDNISVIKRSIQRLKAFAIQEDTTAIIITANNRASMATGDSDLNSGRDTSNIEYGADLHLGLMFAAVAEKTKTIDEIRAIRRAYWKDPKDPAAIADYEQYCGRLALRVNKNRHGPEGREAILHFIGSAALFIQEDTRHTEPPKAGRRI